MNESRAEGLGEQFLDALAQALQRVAEYPASFPAWGRDLRFRRIVIVRFPYVVFYRDQPEEIEVVAVAHGARRPGYWLKRK